MPQLVRLYIRHVLIGFALAGVFVALLIGFDVARLRHLVLASDRGALALVMLVVANGIVFAGVQFGLAVMRLGEEDAPGSGGGRRDALPAVPVQVPAVPVSVPVPVPAGGRRREPRQP